MFERLLSVLPDFRFHQSPEKNLEKIQMGGCSQAEDLCPKNNQDAFFVDPTHLIFGVFDGVGGEPHGRLASSTCSKLIQQYLLREIPRFPNLNNDETKEVLQNICSKVASTIFTLHQQSHTDMGYTTGVFGIIIPRADGTRKAFIVNVGDSRAYLIRHNVLSKETRDQNYVSHPNQDRLDKLDGKNLDKFKQYYVHDDQTVFQLYGQQNIIIPAITEIDLEPKDVLLFVTDGIYKNLTSREILSTYKKNNYENINNISQKFVNQAYKRRLEGHCRSTPDDMTAVIIKLSK